MKTQGTTVPKKASFKLAPDPCSSCPYRKDTPPGVWAQEEYDKLPEFDNQWTTAVFLCHQGPPDPIENHTLCRGWIEVQHRNFGVRLACHRVEWTEQNKQPSKVKMYASGEEARRAGMRGIKRPSTKAQRVIAKIASRKAKRLKGAAGL